MTTNSVETTPIMEAEQNVSRLRQIQIKANFALWVHWVIFYVGQFGFYAHSRQQHDLDATVVGESPDPSGNNICVKIDPFSLMGHLFGVVIYKKAEYTFKNDAEFVSLLSQLSGSEPRISCYQPKPHQKFDSHEIQNTIDDIQKKSQFLRENANPYVGPKYEPVMHDFINRAKDTVFSKSVNGNCYFPIKHSNVLSFDCKTGKYEIALSMPQFSNGVISIALTGNNNGVQTNVHIDSFDKIPAAIQALV